MLRFLLVVASVSLQRVAAYTPPECHQYLAQQAALEVVDKAVVKKRLGSTWHTFNKTRYTTSQQVPGSKECTKIFPVIRDHDITYVTV